MKPDQLAEAFRILGVHGNKRLELATHLLKTTEPLSLPELAAATGIARTKIYYVTEPLRDANILQATRPTEPHEWRAIYSPKALRRKRHELGTPTRYTLNQANLREALTKKADEATAQILSPLREAGQ
jgi:sugar-specific transcriptional regulator TrmB